MRLWSLHPRYLDTRGLVALWREALLAQAVLQGKTRGYRHHPQLERFREHERPVGAIATYLRAVQREAKLRGYRFDARKISRSKSRVRLTVTRGQLEYEWRHLLGKVRRRDPDHYRKLGATHTARSHPSFRVVRGEPANWEKR